MQWISMNPTPSDLILECHDDIDEGMSTLHQKTSSITHLSESQLWTETGTNTLAYSTVNTYPPSYDVRSKPSCINSLHYRTIYAIQLTEE